MKSYSALKTEADGRWLALELIEQMEVLGLDELCVNDEGRDGRAQSDILARYLRLARAAPAPVEKGFLSVLSDVIATEIAGSNTPIDDWRAILGET